MNIIGSPISACCEQGAKQLAHALKEDAINIRCVQEGDSLIEIVKGLSNLRFDPKKDDGIGIQWKDVFVEYMHHDMDFLCLRLKEQAKENPLGKLSCAYRIYEGQYVGLHVGPKETTVVIGESAPSVAKHLRKIA